MLSERERQILDGATRVMPSDLVARGLVELPIHVVWPRPKLGEEHHALIREDGSTVVETDDGPQVYVSMNAAAQGIAGRPINAWTAWQVSRGQGAGALLNDLRRSLLEQLEGEAQAEHRDADGDDAEENRAASDGDSPEEDVESETSARAEVSRAERISDFLDGAAARATTEPTYMTVRSLLDVWDASRRGALITATIQNALTTAGLQTSPDFTQVSLETVVSLTPSTDASDVNSTDEATGEQVDRKHDSADARPHERSTVVGAQPSAQGVTVGTLAKIPLKTVARGAPLDKAMTIMLMHDYGQLGVEGSQKTLVGVVTWRSAAQALQRWRTESLKVSAATVQAARFPFDHPLLRAIPEIVRDGFVFVDQPDGGVGIVTSSDLSTAYGELASPFMLIGEIDRMLRSVVKTLPSDALPRSIDLDKAMFGDYLEILGSANAWRALGWPLDRQEFASRLKEVNDVRNDLMHFNNVDPPGVQDLDRMHHFSGVLRTYASGSSYARG